MNLLTLIIRRKNQNDEETSDWKEKLNHENTAVTFHVNIDVNGRAGLLSTTDQNNCTFLCVEKTKCKRRKK